jgi:hypothetical protein
MNTVRTTITFDSALYRRLSVQAAMMGVGISKLVNKKLVNGNVGFTVQTIEEKIAQNRAFFRSLGRKMGQTDWTKLVREERDRDHA